MIRAKLEIHTNYFSANGKIYCAYCGKEIKPDVEIDHGEETKYYHCNCDDALKEIEMKQKIASYEKEIYRLNHSFPNAKYKAKKVITEEIVKI